MNNIYIFGDSFSINGGNNYSDWAWIKQLSKKHNVINCSQPGHSNQDIMLDFLEHSNVIDEHDFVIIGWTDPNRCYTSKKKDPNFLNIHQTMFYHHIVSQVHYNGCLNKVKQVVKDKKINLLVFWSFPSDYQTRRNASYCWNGIDFQKLTQEEYIYDVEFDNEIRPALIYFSRQEVPTNYNDAQVAKFFANDCRPNHINDQEIHNQLASVVEKFVNQIPIGHTTIYKREKNGS